MRVKRIVFVLALAACKSGGDPAPDDAGVTTDASPIVDPDAGGTQTPQQCTPGASTFCRCFSGQEGTQTCSDDGLTLGPCEPCDSVLPDGGI